MKSSPFSAVQISLFQKNTGTAMFHKSLLKQPNYKVLHKGHFVSFKWNNNKINPRSNNTSHTPAFKVNLFFCMSSWHLLFCEWSERASSSELTCFSHYYDKELFCVMTNCYQAMIISHVAIIIEHTMELMIWTTHMLKSSESDVIS